MYETTLKKTILLMMKRDALDSMIFEQRFQKKVMSRFRELSKNQPRIIRIIDMEGTIMPSTIGNYTGMDKSSLTRMIDDLEKKGIVFRKNDPEDRRKVLISLTARGLECCDYFDEVINETLSSIDRYDAEDFLHSLETMVTILEKTAQQRI